MRPIRSMQFLVTYIDGPVGESIRRSTSSGSGSGDTGAKMSTPVSLALSLFHFRPRDEAMSDRPGIISRLPTMPLPRFPA